MADKLVWTNIILKSDIHFLVYINILCNDIVAEYGDGFII